MLRRRAACLVQVRVLLTAAGGVPAALPGAVAGQLVAVEPVVQTEAVRRRIKFLGHLPLNGVHCLMLRPKVVPA